MVDAFFKLSESIKNQVKIIFVGDFEDNHSKNNFLEKIKKSTNLTYLGKFIDGLEKKELYINSHIFCLPTYYPFEGQPISILEAYATGCVVVTTNHSGIPYIFKHLDNGYEVQKKSIESIVNGISYLVENKTNLKNIAVNNRNLAFTKFRTEIFENNLKTILNCA